MRASPHHAARIRCTIPGVEIGCRAGVVGNKGGQGGGGGGLLYNGGYVAISAVL